MGKHVPRHWVLPIFILTVAAFGLLVSFPFASLTVGTVLFLASIPISVARYRKLQRADRAGAPQAQTGAEAPPPA
jgi:CDP-diacylglycerol--serine O-phosphatidyltransferase